MTTHRGRSKERIGRSVERKSDHRSGSAQAAYRRLVRSSSNTFRSSIEFKEKPRQIVFGIFLLLAVAGIAVLNTDNATNTVASCKNAVCAFIISLVGYAMLQTKDGLMVCVPVIRLSIVL